MSSRFLLVLILLYDSVDCMLLCFDENVVVVFGFDVCVTVV